MKRFYAEPSRLSLGATRFKGYEAQIRACQEQVAAVQSSLHKDITATNITPRLIAVQKNLSAMLPHVKAMHDGLNQISGKYGQAVGVAVGTLAGMVIAALTKAKGEDEEGWEVETEKERLAREKKEREELAAWRNENDKLDSGLRREYEEVAEDEIKEYITFPVGVNQDDIDPVFLRRLAAWVRDYGDGEKLVITGKGGFRTYDDQVKLYKESGGYLKNGKWVGGDGSAGCPEESWHEYGVAIDIDYKKGAGKKLCDFAWGPDRYNKPNPLSKEAKEQERKMKEDYGLCKPVYKPDNKKDEGYHVQPIETKEQPKTITFQQSFLNDKNRPKTKAGKTG